MEGAPAIFADTNVLVSTVLRNLFLELADARAIRLYWSEDVLSELVRTLKRLRPATPLASFDSLIAAMNESFPDALVGPIPFERLSATLPDLNDRHVLAAALAVPCAAIATFNLRDFPANELAREGSIRAAHPDTLLVSLITTNPAPALAALFRAQHTFKAPPLSDPDFLALIARIGLPQTADLLRHLRQG